MTDSRDVDGRSNGGTHGAEEDLLGPELRDLLRSLPKAIPPDRDLTAEIAAQTWDSREKLPGTGSLDAVATTRTVRASPWWGVQGLKLAAAAVILVIVTASVTTMLVRDQGGANNDATATVAGATIDLDPGESASFARYEAVENQYASAISDLLAALEADRERLAPETVRLIEENLGIIDEAIRQTLTALEVTPQSVPLQQAVMTSYERKLDFLRQAAAITAEG
jgi:hypothetical protein